MRAFTDSFIVSNPGQNYTVSELHHCITSSVKSAHFLTGEMIVPASKRYFSIVVPQLDGRGFPTFMAKRQRTWKRQKVLQNSPNQRPFGETNTNASECTAQNNSIFAFAFDNISWPSSFWDLWINFSSFVNV